MRRVVYSLLLSFVCLFSTLLSRTPVHNFSTLSPEDRPKIVIPEQLRGYFAQMQARGDLVASDHYSDDIYDSEFYKQVQELALQMLVDKAPEGIPAGTLIKIPGGYIPVEQLENEMVVVSFDEEAGELAESRVVDVRKTMIQELIVATLADGRTMQIAPDCPFYHHKTGSWLLSYNLDEIKEELAAYYELDVLSVEKVTLEEPETVYLLMLEPYHNFFITTDDILVHNYWVRLDCMSYVMDGAFKLFGVVIDSLKSVPYAAAVGAGVVAAQVVVTSLWEWWFGKPDPVFQEMVAGCISTSNVANCLTPPAGCPPGILTQEELQQGRMMETRDYQIPAMTFNKLDFKPTEDVTNLFVENGQEYIENTHITREIIAQKKSSGRLKRAWSSSRKQLARLPLVGSWFKEEELITIRETSRVERYPKPQATRESSWKNKSAESVQSSSNAPLKVTDAPAVHYEPIAMPQLVMPFSGSTPDFATESKQVAKAVPVTNDSIIFVTNTKNTTEMIAQPTTYRSGPNACLDNGNASLVLQGNLGEPSVVYSEKSGPIVYDTVIDESGRAVERATRITQLTPETTVGYFTPQNPDMISFVGDAAAHNDLPTMIIRETSMTEQHVEFPTPRTPELNIGRTPPIAPFTQPTPNLESTLQDAQNRPRPIIYEMNGITSDPCKKSSSNPHDSTSLPKNNTEILKELHDRHLNQQPPPVYNVGTIADQFLPAVPTVATVEVSTQQAKNNSPYDSTRAYLAGLPLGPIIDQEAVVSQLEALDKECQALVVSSKNIERAPPLSSDERLNLERTQISFDDTYQEIIADATSSWGTALLRRRDALNRTLAGEQFCEKTYHLAEELELFLDDADLERLRSRTGNQLTTELHEELLVVCNRLCALDPEQIYQPFSLSRAILASAHYGLETLDKGNLVTSSALANVCWALQDDMLLDLTLTSAYDDLMGKAFDQTKDIGNSLPFIFAQEFCEGAYEGMKNYEQRQREKFHKCVQFAAGIPEGGALRAWNITKWLLAQPGQCYDNPELYIKNKVNTVAHITQSLGILSNTNYEPLCDEYDFSWTGSDIQDRLALNDASNEAWVAAWTAVGKQIKKDYNESTPRTAGNSVGAYIVDCLIINSLKPHPLGQAFRVTLEEAAVKGELSTLSLNKLDLMRQFFRKSIKETVIESAKISYTKEAFAQFLQEMMHKNPAWFNIPITEETLSKLFTNLVGELKIVPYTVQELAQMQLYECVMAAATTQAERTACGALLEGIALSTAGEIGSLLTGPVIAAGGQIFVPPSGLIASVPPIIAPTTPTIIPATPIVPASPSVVPPTSGIVPPTGAPSIIVPAGVTPPGSVLMANGQVYTPAATAGIVPGLAPSVAPATTPPIAPQVHQTPLAAPTQIPAHQAASIPKPVAPPIPQSVFQATPVQPVVPQPAPIQPVSAQSAMPPVGPAQPPVTPPIQSQPTATTPPPSQPVGFCQQNQPMLTSDIRKLYERQINALMKNSYSFQSNSQTLAFIDPSLLALPITIDAWHLFFAQFKKDALKGMKLSGMHHDYNNEILPKFGCTLQVTDHFADGAFKAVVTKNGCTLDPKSFFSPNQTRQEVLNLIIEALNNPVIPAKRTKNNLWCINGKTNNGLEIEMYIDDTGIMITAYPVA